jgi:hypothetical protein
MGKFGTRIDPLVVEVHRRSQPRALAVLAKAVAEAGDFDRAEAVARTFNDSYTDTVALTGVLETVAATGNIDRTRGLIDVAVVTAGAMVTTWDKCSLPAGDASQA